MTPSRSAVWALLFVAGTFYEFKEIRRGDDGVPLSVVLRWLFRTDTPTGRAVFTTAVACSSSWLVRHITAGSLSTSSVHTESMRNGMGSTDRF